MTTMGEIKARADAVKREKNDYWILGYDCVNNAYYNTNYLGNKKTHKVRCGGVWFKGKQLFGGEMDITTRKFHYSGSHAWVETTDGKIIDWVINEYLEEDDYKKCVWDKKEMEALGFEYRYYDNEVAIEKKLRKQFGKCSEFCRQVKGNWRGSSIKSKREWAEYDAYRAKRVAEGKEYSNWYYFHHKDKVAPDQYDAIFN